MVQVAAALLFALAAGLGVTVIIAMLKSNEAAILSALLGEGAFPLVSAPKSWPAPRILPLRHAATRGDMARCVPAALSTPAATQPRRLTFA